MVRLFLFLRVVSNGHRIAILAVTLVFSMTKVFGQASSESSRITVSLLPVVLDRIPPVTMIEKGPGHLFFDFGLDTFAGLELKIPHPTNGQKITVLLGEALADPQTLNPKPGASIRFLASEVNLESGQKVYRVPLGPKDMRGMTSETGPVMPFRYVEVEGAPAGFGKDNIQKLDVHYPFDEDAASFDSSNPDLNAIWKLCCQTMKATSFTPGGVDGDRERLAYEGDAYIQQLGWYACTTDVTFPRYSWQHLVTHPTWPTEWIMFNVLLAWNDYQYTGDKAGLEEFYPDLQAKTLMALERPNGLISTKKPKTPPDVEQSIHFLNPQGIREIVDWPKADLDQYEMKPVNTVVNAFHVLALRRMADIAKALGKTDDASKFAAAADLTEKSINEKLFDSTTGLYVDGEGSTHSSMHANFFPLAFGIVPPEWQEKVAAYLAGRNMDCSIYGAQFFIDALFEHGQADRAVALMTTDGDRSWSHMVHSGATMTWEAWNTNDKPNLDWNHAWGAAPANQIPRDLMGIKPLEPGFAKALIAPHSGTMKWAEIRIPTVKGSLSVRFDNDGDYRLTLDLPQGMTARVGVPTSAPDGVVSILLDGVAMPGRVNAGTAFLDNVGPGKHTVKLR